jgi:hypothetical protein
VVVVGLQVSIDSMALLVVMLLLVVLLVVTVEVCRGHGCWLFGGTKQRAQRTEAGYERAETEVETRKLSESSRMEEGESK